MAWIILGLVAGTLCKALAAHAGGKGIASTVLLGIVSGSLGVLVVTGSLILANPISLSRIAVTVIGSTIAVFLFNLVAQYITS